MEQKQYKRQYRQLSQITKDKIRQSLSGVKKSPEHCRNISTGLKKMWELIPDRPTTDNDNSVI